MFDLKIYILPTYERVDIHIWNSETCISISISIRAFLPECDASTHQRQISVMSLFLLELSASDAAAQLQRSMRIRSIVKPYTEIKVEQLARQLASVQTD